MVENRKPTASGHGPTRRAFTTDSAEHLFAAFPVLLAIANWTGKLGRDYIKAFILSGKIKEAKRNAAIIATAIIAMFLIIIACIIWLATL
jgi:hypothetical protein